MPTGNEINASRTAMNQNNTGGIDTQAGQAVRFDDRVYRITAENLPRVIRHNVQIDQDEDLDYKTVSKGKEGRIQRKEDEKELEKLRKETDNAHISLYGMRYINRALEQRRIREYYWKNAMGKMDSRLAKADKDLTVFLKDDETAYKSNVKLLSDMGSGEQELMRPHLEDMMADILCEDLAWGMLNEHWLADNAAELSEKLEKFRVFGKLYEQNPWFKESLSDTVRELIENKLNEGLVFSDALQATYEREGIDTKKLSFKKNFHYRANKSLKSEETIKKELGTRKNEFKKALAKDLDITQSLKFMNDEEQTLEKAEIKRTDAPENVEYKKAKQSLRNIPEKNKKGFEQALLNMSKHIGDFKIKALDYKTNTVTRELKDASHDYLLLLHSEKEKGYKAVSFEDKVNALLRLSAAANAYRHVKGSGFNPNNSGREQYADTIIRNADILIDNCIDEEDKRVAVLNLENYRLTDDKKAKSKVSEASDQIDKLHTAWKTWRNVQSRNLLDTPEERLLKYKTIFDDYREALQLWASNQELFEKYGTDKINKYAQRAVEEYTRVNRELAFIQWARKTGKADKIQNNTADARIGLELSNANGLKELAPLDGSVDKDIKEQQSKGVLEVDQWVLRNINTNDQSEMVTRLLRKSKRERLFIYYLIENRARLKPTFEHLELSQKSYYPNLGRFKEQMVKSRFKIMARFSKDSIYWDKIRQAMDICDGNRCLMREMYEPKDMVREAAFDDEMTSGRKLRALETRIAIDRLRKLVVDCGGDENELLKHKDEISSCATDVKQAFNKMIAAEMNEKGDVGSKQQDALKEADGLEKTVGLGALGTLSELESFGTGGAVTGGALAVLGGTLSLFYQITDLCMEWSDISGAELVSKIAELTSNVTSLAGNAWKKADHIFSVSNNVSKDVAQKTAAKVADNVTLISSGVNVAVGVAKYISVRNNSAHASSAKAFLKSKYESGQVKAGEREKKYDLQLQKLSEKIINGKKNKAYGYIATGVFGVASVLVPAVWMLPTAFGVVASGSKYIFDYLSGNAISSAGLELINGFTEIDKLLPVVIAERRGWKKVENSASGRTLFKDVNGRFHDEREIMDAPETEMVKKSLQKRIAGKYNFSSYNSMLVMAAKRYALFIHEKLFPAPGEDGEYYKQLLGSLGLSYKAPVGSKPGSPSIDQIAKKIMGK